MQKLPKDFQVLIVVTILGASALILLLSPQVDWERWPQFLLFIVLIAVTAMYPIPNPRGGKYLATPPLFYVLFSVHGPAAGILIGVPPYVAGTVISRGWVPWRRLWNGAQIGICAAFGGIVFKALGGSVSRLDLVNFLLPFALAALTYSLSNNFFVALFFSRLERLPLLSTWLSDIWDVLWSIVLSVPSAAILIILYVSYHHAFLFLFLASLPLQNLALRFYFQDKKIYTQAIDSLVEAIDSNFPEGKGHSRRVADTAVAIARHMKLSEPRRENIGMAALLHDVGMIGLDDTPQSTAGKALPSAERLREHVRRGAEVARQLPRRGPEVAEIVLSHHENYDGSGYPQGIKGTQIPLGARIVALAEEYESMMAPTSPVRLSPLQAVEIIKGQSGKILDPRVVSAFLSVLEKGDLVSESSPLGEVKTQTVPGSGAIG